MLIRLRPCGMGEEIADFSVIVSNNEAQHILIIIPWLIG